MANVTKSLAISLAESYIIIILQLGTFVLIARFLTPNEIGLYSVSVAVTGIVHLLRDFGVGSYLIQEKEITNERIRTAFTITLMISIFFFALFQFASPMVADFYRDERMIFVLRMLSINFLIIPFNSTTIAILRRNMGFEILIWFNLSAAVVGTTTVLMLAFLGFGYMSLVWSAIASTVTTCLAGLIYRRSEFWLRPTLKEWRRVFYFGSRVTFTNALTHIAININDLVISRVLGFSAVALLSRAQGVMNLFHRDVMSAIRNVAYPVFAQAHRQGSNLDQIHSRSVAAITAFAWPFYGFLAIYSLESLRLLFGPQWDAAAPLVPVFCLAGAIAALWSLALQAITAAGRIDLTTRAELMIQPLRILALAICALFFSTLMPYAVAFLVIYVLVLPIVYWHKQIVLPTDWVVLRAGLSASLKLTLFSLSAPLALKVVLMVNHLTIPEYVVVPLAGVLCAGGWLWAIRWFAHPVVSDPVVPERLRRFLSCSR